MPQALQQFSSLLEALAIPLTTTTMVIEGQEQELAQGQGHGNHHDKTTKRISSSSSSSLSSSSSSSSTIYHRAMVRALLDVFRCLNDPCMKSVLTVEYVKTLVADLAHACLLRSSESILLEEDAVSVSKRDKGKGSASVEQQQGKQGQSSKHRSSKRTNEPSSSSEEASSDSSTYTTAHVIEDVEQVLICLGSPTTNQRTHYCNIT